MMKKEKKPVVLPDVMPLSGLNPLGPNPMGMAPLGFIPLGADPLGSYTGVTEELLEEPVQDADDL